MAHVLLSEALLKSLRERAGASSVEVGGLLLGTLDGVQDIVWLRGEQPFTGRAGPRSVRPTRRELRLRASNGRQVLGWWHSHPRDSAGLSRRDLDFHRRLFREPWQVAMVVGGDGGLGAYGWEGGEVRAVPRVTTFADADRTG